MKNIKVFTKKNCAPCESVKSYFETQSVKPIFVSAFDEPDQASKYRIMSVPTILLLNENDEVIQQSIGFNPVELDSILKEIE